jgi:pyruvate dehydrogenase E2 component (dihydrolipoamide acetyltransferase)
MGVEIKVPRLGWSMEEGTFVEWLKRDGDFVESGQPLFAIEGDKAIQEVEAIGSGILRISPRAPESGEPVRVGVTLAFLIAANEANPFAGPQPDAPPPKPDAPNKSPEIPQPKAPRPEKPGPDVPKPGPGPSKTPRPAVPGPEIPSPKTPEPSTPSPGREIPSSAPSEPEIAPAEPPQQEPGAPTLGIYRSESRSETTNGSPESHGARRKISPRAAHVAADLGIDLDRLHGTGRGGRIRERDVRAVAADRRTSAPSAARSAVRRTIARRMTEGAHETAPVTLTTTADATNLVSLRRQFKSAAPAHEAATPGYLAFITKLAARALTEHPQLNQQWIDGRIATPDGIHVAIAVDASAGLLAPVLRDVPDLSVREIATRLADLTTRAHAGQLTLAELTGGTFTISNLGAFGIDAFTPILNVPQCAILGLGRIERRPAVVDEQIVPRDQMVLSLTFDHRIVDGAPAAKFLATLRQAIENPGAWLVS